MSCPHARRGVVVWRSVIFACLTFLQPTIASASNDVLYDYNNDDSNYDDDDDNDKAIGLEPTFDVPVVNVTVVKGQTAVLPCSIEYLGKYKVAWLDHNSIPLTYEDRRVVDDTRFSVVRPFVKEWNLLIRDIQLEDQGQYRCTINTNPIKNKMIMLHVKVAAEIIAELSSNDVTANEGDTVALVCNVTGIPQPEITWHRKSTSVKMTSEPNAANLCNFPGPSIKGEVVVITNVSRHCDDVYECVAENGVPPAVSRRVRVTVEFAPEIEMPNKRIGQVIGRETILECMITAFPQAVNYWEKGGRRIASSSKYRIEAYDEGDHTLTLNLRIQITDVTDFGEYKCVASNALGREAGTMYLYEYSHESEPRPRGAAGHGTKHRDSADRRVVTHYPVVTVRPALSKDPHAYNLAMKKSISTRDSSSSNTSRQHQRLMFSILLTLFLLLSNEVDILEMTR